MNQCRYRAKFVVGTLGWRQRASNLWWLLALSLLIGLRLLACGPSNSQQKSDTAEAAGATGAKTGQIQKDKPLHDDVSGAPMVDYEPIPLPRLIGLSDLAVVGNVKEIHEESFTFRIEDVLIGEPQGQCIEVVKFVPTRFDCPRAMPYAIEQSFVLFLVKEHTDRSSKRWKVWGIGGEGEMPLENDYVYFHGRFVEGLERRKYIVQGAERMIQRYQATAFIGAVRDYRTCFAWQAGAGKSRPQPRRICDDRSLEQYHSQSGIHAYLVKETLKQIPE
jgi:hypothetical protein